MKCVSCDREIEVGDRYIEDTTGGFMGIDVNPEVDSIMSELLSDRDDGKITFCIDCTTSGGTYEFKTYYGDDGDDGDDEEEEP